MKEVPGSEKKPKSGTALIVESVLFLILGLIGFATFYWIAMSLYRSVYPDSPKDPPVKTQR